MPTLRQTVLIVADIREAAHAKAAQS